MVADLHNMIDGRYRLEVELGRGGFGAVYRAKQVALGVDLRDVALKLFHEGAVTSKNVLEKMNDAIQLVNVLSEVEDISVGQHFIDVYDLGVTSGDKPQAYIAMELVRGGSLQQRERDRGKFNVKATMQYLLQITRAIGFMHTRPKPMIHRDLKPDNILLIRRGELELVKIADFGLAAMLDSAMTLSRAAGTLAYMAPEAFEYATSIPASDVYSIGLIAYELLFNEQPFHRIGSDAPDDDKKGQAVARQVHIESRKAGIDICPELSLDLLAHPKLVAVLRKMLEHDVDKRYTNAQSVHDDLYQISRDDWPEGVFELEGPAKVDPDQGFDKLQREVDYHLGTENFSRASQAAVKMVSQFPRRHESYIAVSSVYQAQAGSGALRQKFLQRAAKVIFDGLADVNGDDLNRLEKALARVYEKLGDPKTAAYWRNMWRGRDRR